MELIGIDSVASRAVCHDVMMPEVPAYRAHLVETANVFEIHQDGIDYFVTPPRFACGVNCILYKNVTSKLGTHPGM